MVVARLMMVQAQTGRFDEVAAVFDAVADRITKRAGFRGSTFLQDRGRRELGSLTLWASRADADAGAAANFEAITRAFEAAGGRVIRHDLFEVTAQVRPTS